MPNSGTLPSRHVLCVLDGLGFFAKTPPTMPSRAPKALNFRKGLGTGRLHALWKASEECVGLPKGQIGNSLEVGHTISARAG